MQVARGGQRPWLERMLYAALAAAQSTVDMIDLLAYRSDLYRSRRQLRALTDEQLRDVGLTRGQAEAEAGRPFFEI